MRGISKRNVTTRDWNDSRLEKSTNFRAKIAIILGGGGMVISKKKVGVFDRDYPKPFRPFFRFDIVEPSLANRFRISEGLRKSKEKNFESKNPGILSSDDQNPFSRFHVFHPPLREWLRIISKRTVPTKTRDTLN